jgi:hypothetical protein
MAWRILDRVRFATPTAGTGSIAVGSALGGFQTPAQAGAANNDVFDYVIEDMGGAWEIGEGTYTSAGPTLARTTIIGSSNAGAAINLSGSAVCTMTLPTWSTVSPRALAGHISGLALTPDAANGVLDIAVGSAASDDGVAAMALQTAFTKSLNAVWAAGTGAGGLDTGAAASGTAYYVYLIGPSLYSNQTLQPDILFSLSATAPAMPSNYTRKKLIGSVTFKGAAALDVAQSPGSFGSLSCHATASLTPSFRADNYAFLGAYVTTVSVSYLGTNTYWDQNAAAWKIANTSPYGAAALTLTSTTFSYSVQAGAVTAGNNASFTSYGVWTTRDFPTAPLLLTGGTMTGMLTMSGVQINSNNGIYVNGAGTNQANVSLSNGAPSAGWSAALGIWATASGVGYAGLGRSDSTSAYLWYFTAGGSNIGNIYTNGSTTAYNTTCDRSMKENIRDLEDDIDVGELIDSMRPVAFEWKAPSPNFDVVAETRSLSNTGHGFVAQELYEVAPIAVTPPLPDPPGRKSADNGPHLWGADYSKLIPYLVSELQSLRKRVAELESQLP